MTLRAAVWEHRKLWIVEWCPAIDYEPTLKLRYRALYTPEHRQKHFRTFAEAIEYAHQITHQEQE